MLLYGMRHGFSELFVKTIVLKNLVIGFATFKTIAYFSHCYQNTFNTLIIDSCFFSPFQFLSKSLPNVEKVKIINCTRMNTFSCLFDCFKDDLEELVLEKCHFSPKFSIPFNLKLMNLQCTRLIRCSLNASILKDILTLFSESLHTLELSHLCINGENDNYIFLEIIQLLIF